MQNGFRISPQQRQIWRAQQAGAPTLALCALRISGAFAVERWLAALRLTVQRHEILRTTFRLLPGTHIPLQYIADEPTLAHRVYDLQSELAPERAARLAVLIEAAEHEEIDLASGPVLHATQIILQPAEQCWILALPTMCADTPTLRYLVAEVCATYRVLDGGAEQPEATVQYADVAEILNQEAEQAASAGRAVAEPPAGSGRLVFERDAQTEALLTTARCRWEAGPELLGRLRELASARQTTPSTLLLACWAALLWRLSDHTIQSVGLVSSGRLYAELEQAIGPYDTVLPLAYQLDAAQTLDELIGQIAQGCEALGEEPVAPDSAAGPRFTFETLPLPAPLPLDPQSVCVIEHEQALLVPFAAQLSVREGDDRLVFAIDYRAEHDAAAVVERLAEGYRELLAAALAVPARPLCQHSLIGQASRDLLLRQFNQTELAYDSGASLDRLFSDQARRTPERVAVQYEDHQLTYADLEARSNQLARALLRRGVRPEQPVALYLERSTELITALLAVLKAGAAYLPIDPSYPRARVLQILEDTRAAWVLTQTALAEQLPDQGVALCLDRDWPRIAEEPEVPLTGPEARRSLAYVLYTSGSTGVPKGVMVEHSAVVNLVAGLQERFYRRLSGPVRVALLAAYVFDASVQQIFSALLLGHTLVIAPEAARRDGHHLLRFYQQQRITISDGTPALLTILLSGAATSAAILPVQEFLIGGEALPPALVRQFYRTFGEAVRLTNIYGPAECCVDTNAYTVRPDQIGMLRSIPIGPPLPNRRAYVLDEQLQPVPIGVPGELYIAGHGLGRGYWNRPDLTAARFLPDPFDAGQRMYRTGDRCRWLPDGSLDFLERVDRQVQIRGFRVELEEVEAALQAHPAVRAAVVAVRQRQQPAVRTCARCFLTSNMPGLYLDTEGVCNVCRAYEQHGAQIAGYFQDEAALRSLFERVRADAAGDYDCLFLYSGGKDSTYALYRLAELGLRLLVVSVDNGFLSPHARSNIQRVCADLGVDLEVVQPRRMNEIFVESLRSNSSVCDGCFRAITVLGSRMALERGIPTMVTALSRGQIYTKLTNFLLQHQFDPQRIDQELLAFRKVHYTSRDRMGLLIHDNAIPASDAGLDRLQVVDFFRYCDVTQEELLGYLRARGNIWQMPPDTSYSSSDCLINEAGVSIHLQERGYHFYADQVSWEMRIGHISAELARAKLDMQTSEPQIRRMLSQIGYREPIKQAAQADVYLCAYVIPSGDVTADELRGALAERLPDYMVPSAVVFCESFPLTVNGKIDERALPEPDVARQRAIRYVAPSNPIEQWLASLWEEVLGVARAGVHDTFFELGGHSLAATQVMTRTCQAFQIELPLRTIFEHHTIAALAQVVQQRLTEQMIAQVAQLSQNDVQKMVGRPEEPS
ncbi:MAG: hypothetical protein OHK0022_11980 [Roseiflexaceae bacterium]